jgi:hypothetical protein
MKIALRYTLHGSGQQNRALIEMPECMSGFKECFQLKATYQDFITLDEYLKLGLTRILCSPQGPHILLEFIQSPFDLSKQKQLMDAFHQLSLSSLLGVYIPHSLEKQLIHLYGEYVLYGDQNLLKRFKATYQQLVTEEFIADIHEELDRLPSQILKNGIYDKLIEEIKSALAENNQDLARVYFGTMMSLVIENEFSALCSTTNSSSTMRNPEVTAQINGKPYFIDFELPKSEHEPGAFASIISCCESLVSMIISKKHLPTNFALVLDSPYYCGWLNESLTQMSYFENPNTIFLYPAKNQPFPDYMTFECLEAGDSIISMTFPTRVYSPDSALQILQDFKNEADNIRQQHPQIIFTTRPCDYYLESGLENDETDIIRSFYAETRMRQLANIEEQEENRPWMPVP